MADGVVQESSPDPGIRVDPPVPEERPVAPHLLHAREVHLGDDEGLLVGGPLRDDDAKRISEEGMSPELDAGALPVELFEADAIHRRDPAAVRDGVAPLDRAPCSAVSRAPSGYHWSQHTSVPIAPTRVSNARKPRSPGVK